MAPLPKRKHSTRRKGKRRASKTMQQTQSAKQHRVDEQGMYKGVQIVTPKSKKEDSQTHQAS